MPIFRHRDKNERGFTLLEVLVVLAKRFTLPEGWSVTGAPVHITQSGICQGANLRIMSDKQRIADYLLKPPYCEATRLAAPI